MVRERMSPARIAAGWAIGMFTGCAIPFGLQLIVSVPLAVATRTSKIGATVATFVTNPVSIFFIYPVQTWVGSRLIGSPLGWDYIKCDVMGRLAEASLLSREGWSVVCDLGMKVLGGFFVVVLLLAALLTPPTYFIVRRIVVAHRERAVRRRPRNDIS